ncbi:MAG TPA: CHAD domain-containing protein [Sporichthya sp.]|nr:CHAD domain-containing protein [Sporichthya sp.]
MSEFRPYLVRTDPPPAPPPEEAVPGPVGPDDPAREAIRASLARNAAKLARHESGVRTGAPDSVRKLRIAARRLRSDLSTFRPLLDPEWARALGQELGALARTVGATRDREVTLHRLERDVAVLPAGAPREETLAYLRTALAADLAGARQVAVSTLDSDGTAALIAAVREAAEDPRTNATADQSCRAALPPLVAVAYRRLAKRARFLHLAAPGTAVHAEADDAWHDARLLAKKARYAADACVPVFGAPSAELALRLADVTRCLGEHQDAAIAAAAAIELGRQPDCPAPAALGLGLLHGVQREAVLAARAIFVDVWPDVRPYARAHEDLAH